MFVSVGHRIDLRGAKQVPALRSSQRSRVLARAIRYRLPEPTRLADQLVGAGKRAMG